MQNKMGSAKCILHNMEMNEYDSSYTVYVNVYLVIYSIIHMWFLLHSIFDYGVKYSVYFVRNLVNDKCITD